MFSYNFFDLFSYKTYKYVYIYFSVFSVNWCENYIYLKSIFNVMKLFSFLNRISAITNGIVSVYKYLKKVWTTFFVCLLPSDPHKNYSRFLLLSTFVRFFLFISFRTSCKIHFIHFICIIFSICSSFYSNATIISILSKGIRYILFLYYIWWKVLYDALDDFRQYVTITIFPNLMILRKNKKKHNLMSTLLYLF